MGVGVGEPPVTHGLPMLFTNQVSYKCIFSNRSGSEMSGSKSGSADVSGTGSGGGPEGY